MRGTAYVFDDEINTDYIAPGGLSTDDLVENLMAPIRSNFSDEITEGDLIVAGEHFGSGSSREAAPQAIQEAGLAAVVAESFSRIYYRNSINIGLPALTASDVTDHVSEGDKLKIDMDQGVIQNVSTGETIQSEPVPEELQLIYDAGGIFKYYQDNPGGLKSDPP